MEPTILDAQPCMALSNTRMPSRYRHKPLDETKDQFRLVRFLSRGPERVECTLETFDPETSPPYVAVSYAWGDLLETRDIYVDGYALSVTTNLYSFLIRKGDERTFEKLPNFKKETNPIAPELYLWIDQISINQDSISEKNHQVRQMRRIFGQATEVLAWLGCGDDNSNQAMDHFWDNSLNFNHFARYRTSLRDKPSPHDLERFEQYVKDHEEDLEKILQLCERPYWKRLWIVQEIILARKISVYCGSRRVTWHGIELFQFVHTRFGRWSVGVPPTAFVYLRNLLSWRLAKRENSLVLISFHAITPIALFEPWKCSDPRDKIYALHGLFSDDVGIDIDYAKTPQEVFWDAINMANLHDGQQKTNAIRPKIDVLLQSLGLRMGVTNAELKAGGLVVDDFVIFENGEVYHVT